MTKKIDLEPLKKSPGLLCFTLLKMRKHRNIKLVKTEKGRNYLE